MARKEFTYRGRTLEELQGMSVDELTPLFTSDARRKIKRGFTKEEKSLLKKLSKRDRVKTHCREMLILPSMVSKTIMVYTGKEFLPILIQPEMIGKRLGQYILTRKLTKHSQAGITKTKSPSTRNKV